jgi:DNA-binding SARP family transcriptional activator
MRATYEKSLRSVNSYISDARKSVDADPSDEDAREQLMQAYEQKAALYEMAMSRAGE